MCKHDDAHRPPAGKSVCIACQHLEAYDVLGFADDETYSDGEHDDGTRSVVPRATFERAVGELVYARERRTAAIDEFVRDRDEALLQKALLEDKLAAFKAEASEWRSWYETVCRARFDMEGVPLPPGPVAAETRASGRIRAAIACNACRASKTTCHSAYPLPCEACDKKGLHCNYAVPRKRGPKTHAMED